MTYRGMIRNGGVVFDGDAPPEGTVVEILVSEKAESQDNTGANGSVPTTLKAKLLALRGLAPHLPPDAARNHDHYLYGTPKR